MLPLDHRGLTPGAGVTDTVFAERLQEASHFLLGQERQVDLVNLVDVATAMRESIWKPANPYTESGLQSLCRTSDAAYLLVGRSYFTKSSAQIEMRSYSCRLHRELGRAQRKAPLADLQSLLRDCLRRSTPFLNSRPMVLPATKVPQNRVDMAVVLDNSGSMVSDLPAIHRSLQALAGRVPRGSRLGLINIDAGDRLDIMPFSTDWSASLRSARQKRASGEVSLRGLKNALSIINRYREWQSNRRLILFSDATVGGHRRSELETSLRRMKNQGVKISIFPLLNQSHADRIEWNRIRRTLQLRLPPVVYARRLDIVGQDSYYLMSADNRFYHSHSGENLISEIGGSGIDLSRMVPVESAGFLAADLNLQTLPRVFALRQNQKLRGVGPILSNLEKSIVQSVENSIQFSPEGGVRVLIKNEGHSFWIAVRNEHVLRQLENLRGQKVYLGLHALAARTGGDRIQFLPDPVYIRKARFVPRLFISTYVRLNQADLRKLRSSDIWFLLVEVLEIRRP